MSFLGLHDKVFLIFGVANKHSIAYYVGKTLESQGAIVLYSVKSKARKDAVSKLLEGKRIFTCNFESMEEINSLAQNIASCYPTIDGIVHSVAYANYSKGVQPFYQTAREDFLQATQVSCFSLLEVARAFKPYLSKLASVVAVSISSQVTASSYGYMSPIKAALESTTRFLAKSFSADTQIRFNTVNAGPLKTSASAGIPNYIKNYIYAEKMTLRKKALQTQEVADTITYLLSERSSGINAQGITVNAGMDLNYFDEELVNAVTQLDKNKI